MEDFTKWDALLLIIIAIAISIAAWEFAIKVLGKMWKF